MLLKNSDAALPLDRATTKSLAVVGPLADTVRTDFYGGPTPYAISVLAGVRTMLGAGASAVADLGIGTIADALHLRVTAVTVLQGHDGEDTNVRLTMSRPSRRS